MIEKKLVSITLDDLNSLIQNSVPEGKTLEYKEAVTLASDADRKEFLYDVSSFANASGGDMIFGITQNKESGYAEQIVGIPGNMDDLQLQFDSIIRDGIAPRLTGISSRYFQTGEGRHVFILRIPKSWNPPHQVVFKGVDRFYSRSNTGKYKLDVTELHNIFIASDSIRKEIARFVDERVSTIIANEGPVQLLNNGKMILHIVPISNVGSNTQIEISRAMSADNKELLRPLGNQGFLTRYNFDGILSHVQHREGNVAYLQLFRNGIVETADSWVVQPFNNEHQLFVNTIESFILDVFHRIRKLFTTVNVDSPAVALFTITGAKGYNLGVSARFFVAPYDHPVDKDVMRLPPILIENWNEEFDQLLKPWFDALWNAVGFDAAKSYKDGKWIKL